ncbi:hypothetical protein PSACC_00003 [Paramicrosporidium saccamoebae]|uniref:Uncharacterized protein n=1 Tax=Paramicrosporidium saccamoebae TaxID=1246581 RepID=A0A2H9TR12_9FUNG|nr:hypothetical protein PSACC_00003 [Paramicrosporidium saccamoebae]
MYSLVRPKCRISPSEFLNVGKLACDYLMLLPGDTEKKLRQLIQSVTENMNKAQKTLEAVGRKTAGIRAELRCSVGDLAGQMAL